MKTLGIDCRFAASHVGLGRYTRELVTHLMARPRPFSVVLFVRSQDEEWLRELPNRSSARIIVANIPHYSFAEQWRFPSVIKRAKIDLLFSPHFNVPLFCPVPFVVTTHDLILHRFPNQASLVRRFAYRILMRAALNRARRIITVSNFTAHELIDVYGSRLQGKIETVLEGVSPAFFPFPQGQQQLARIKYGLEKPFFLYVGNAKQHKNVQMLIDAYALLNDPSTELILITSGPETARLRLAPGVRFVPGVSDHDLPAIYSAARAAVTASLYEGFGLMIIEAPACGTPVIATRLTALMEIAGDGVTLVQPNVEALADAMRITSGPIEPVRTRSWDTAADKTAAVLHAALPQ